MTSYSNLLSETWGELMGKSKFNKSRCKKCIYHRGLENRNIYCNYGAVEERSCLYKAPDGTIQDRRGTDYDNCQLFVKGDILIKRRPVY